MDAEHYERAAVTILAIIARRLGLDGEAESGESDDVGEEDGDADDGLLQGLDR